MKTTFHQNCSALLNVKTLKFSFQLDQPFRGEEILQKIDGTVFFVDFSRRSSLYYVFTILMLQNALVNICP